MRGNKSVGLKILWWGEIIVSARILLFCIPVLINKLLEKSLHTQSVDDWFIVILTTVALVYFILGIASIMGHKLWRAFHYVTLILVIFLIIGLLRQVAVHSVAFHWAYLSPVIFSVVVTVFATFLKD